MVSSVSPSPLIDASPVYPQQDWNLETSADNKPWGLVESDSFSSACSFGTFGPRHPQHAAHSGSYTAIVPVRQQGLDDNEDEDNFMILSAFRAQFDPDSESLFAPTEELLDIESAYLESGHSSSTMHTSQSTPDGFASSPVSQSETRGRGYDLKRLHASQSLFLHPHSAEETPRRQDAAPSRPPRVKAWPTDDLAEERRVATANADSAPRPRRTGGTSSNRKRNPPQKRKVDPEPEFVWLHGISVDLLIDQEGFRSAIPSFKYSGVNRSKHDATTCTVTFKAASKHGYNFHYNPFDSLPILRRVTIHGEESKDYISKQAQLTLKTNGTYSVHGAEVSSFPAAFGGRLFNPLGQLHEPEKLDWEFKYVVEDRLDAYGMVVDGERKFVPLTFTCSPWLLHPSQGKKVNLLHMFKKGVSLKLTAERAQRMDERRKVKPLPHTVVPAPPKVNIADTVGVSTLGLGVPNAKVHKRTMSHAVSRGGDHRGVPKSQKASGGVLEETRPGHCQGVVGRDRARRRASSVEEGSWIAMI